MNPEKCPNNSSFDVSLKAKEYNGSAPIKKNEAKL
jgi:hypothetical protein